MTIPAETSTLFPAIRNLMSTVSKHLHELPEERRKEWRKLVRYIRSRRQIGQEVEVAFACVHNSRRSIFSQVWATVIADYLGLEGVHFYSGGTVATAVAQAALAHLRDAGLDLRGSGDTLKLHFAEAKPALPLFSKEFGHASLPQSGFAVVMVCDPFDSECPVVPGADLRISVPFEDPKSADGTPTEAKAYSHASNRIATEVFYALNLLSN